MADPNFENTVILNLMSSYGPILIGAIFQSVLYGMAVVQMYALRSLAREQSADSTLCSQVHLLQQVSLGRGKGRENRKLIMGAAATRRIPSG